MHVLCPQILKPMMLRRLKEDVEKNLAAKEETIIEVYFQSSVSLVQSIRKDKRCIWLI